MALHFFDCKGFGQFEPNQCWFKRTGAVEAQCALDTATFASHFPMTAAETTANKIYGEVGQFLMVDKDTRTAYIPTTALSAKGLVMGINYSSEHIYNQFTPGRRNFCMICGEFLPRIGFVSVGETFTTNTVAWDDTAAIFTTTNTDNDSDIMYGDVKAAIAAGTDVYAYVVNGSNGKLTIGAAVADALGEVYAKVVQAYTNADGTNSFKFQIIRKPV